MAVNDTTIIPQIKQISIGLVMAGYRAATKLPGLPEHQYMDVIRDSIMHTKSNPFLNLLAGVNKVTYCAAIK